MLYPVLPDPCPGCGRALEGGETLGLCLGCRGRLRRHRPGCRRCGAPQPGGRVLPPDLPCLPCRRRAPAFAALFSPWRYESPLVEVVHALKFGRCGHLGERLAADLHGHLAGAEGFGGVRRGGDVQWQHGRAADGSRIDAVVPVPLHPVRRWLRGYNQAERIARPLARRLGLPLVDGLRRRRATRTQARLPRDRRRSNVEGSFRVPVWRRRKIRGRRILLVDDVCTTGATLDSAARALRQAGAARVVAVTVARTPAPEGDAAPKNRPSRLTDSELLTTAKFDE